MSEAEKKTRKKKVTEEVKETVEAPIRYEVVNCGALNVRENPDVSSKSISTLKCGTVVDVTGTKGEFYSVRLPDGTKGYCVKNYINRIG